jgi:hypothetical protein
MDEEKIRRIEQAIQGLAAEKVLLDRVIYQFKNRFVKEKPYQTMRQVS